MEVAVLVVELEVVALLVELEVVALLVVDVVVEVVVLVEDMVEGVEEVDMAFVVAVL